MEALDALPTPAWSKEAECSLNIASLPADVIHECVTNEPQRTSAGRLEYSLILGRLRIRLGETAKYFE